MGARPLTKIVFKTVVALGAVAAATGSTPPKTRRRARLAVTLEMKKLDNTVNERVNFDFGIATPFDFENCSAN